MPNPIEVHKNWYSRDFGELFLDIKNDPLKVDNKIDDKKYKKETNKLREYNDEYLPNTPASGKDEIVNQALKK